MLRKAEKKLAFAAAAEPAAPSGKVQGGQDLITIDEAFDRNLLSKEQYKEGVRSGQEYWLAPREKEKEEQDLVPLDEAFERQLLSKQEWKEGTLKFHTHWSTKHQKTMKGHDDEADSERVL